MEIPRHKVFISFQHGCPDNDKPCGLKYIQNNSSSFMLNYPVVNYKACQGYCGRNNENPLNINSKCKNYSICGHYWKERFEHLFSMETDGFISKAVGDGDIDDNLKPDTIRSKIRDEFISDATVTVVLIGPRTWSRRHVDWEISSSIRDTSSNPRCGLLGIFLPTYPLTSDTNGSKRYFNPNTIPPRLYDNWKDDKKRFANLYIWSEDPNTVKGWIHQAFQNRDKLVPDNSYPSFKNNRTGDQWS
jgi:hypothetical protein